MRDQEPAEEPKRRTQPERIRDVPPSRPPAPPGTSAEPPSDGDRWGTAITRALIEKMRARERITHEWIYGPSPKSRDDQ
jgi:hypothetical protein